MCKSRRLPAVAVGVSSVVVFILGCAMIALTLMFNSNGFKDDLAELDGYKNAMFITLLLASILAVITSVVAGCIACKKRHWCCNVNVGVFMFFAWVILLTGGTILGAISLTNEETFISFCDK